MDPIVFGISFCYPYAIEIALRYAIEVMHLCLPYAVSSNNFLLFISSDLASAWTSYNGWLITGPSLGSPLNVSAFYSAFASCEPNGKDLIFCPISSVLLSSFSLFNLVTLWFPCIELTLKPASGLCFDFFPTFAFDIAYDYDRMPVYLFPTSSNEAFVAAHLSFFISLISTLC